VYEEHEEASEWSDVKRLRREFQTFEPLGSI
jgi:hypothetical protein